MTRRLCVASTSTVLWPDPTRLDTPALRILRVADERRGWSISAPQGRVFDAYAFNVKCEGAGYDGHRVDRDDPSGDVTAGSRRVAHTTRFASTVLTDMNSSAAVSWLDRPAPTSSAIRVPSRSGGALSGAARLGLPRFERGPPTTWPAGRGVLAEERRELGARVDAELRKGLVEVVLDRVLADEQPHADFRIGEALGSEAPRSASLAR